MVSVSNTTSKKTARAKGRKLRQQAWKTWPIGKLGIISKTLSGALSPFGSNHINRIDILTKVCIFRNILKLLRNIFFMDVEVISVPAVISKPEIFLFTCPLKTGCVWLTSAAVKTSLNFCPEWV